MAVLVTGGAGFVGLNIVEALLHKGQETVAFDRISAPERALAGLRNGGAKLTVETGDITDKEAVRDIFRNHPVSHVVQGAAITADAKREYRDADSIFQVNLLGTVNLLEAVREFGVDRLVYLSSSSVYGENSFSDPELSEATTLPVPDSLYAITKYAAERTAIRYRRHYDLDIVAARLSAVFGPWERDTGVRDTLSPVLQVTVDARAGRPVVLPRPVSRDWVYVRDVASAIVTLLNVPAKLPNEVYNIGPGTVWTVADWCARLSDESATFTWGIDENAPTVDPHGNRDRSPLAIARIVADTAWRPTFGLNEAFTDYMSWLNQYSDQE